ncbi:nuclear factor interleukin-3-regulated protein-like [Oppia nitens]|uniref:nuclear factor interleukin-3-regulated protein-like n=1 Tax=Oppia nitens TaxID=1686743 RepID=UPI0023D9F71B|nr:nuclear factor interleukin-3-regulated protein-like [Oppia nitens]
MDHIREEEQSCDSCTHHQNQQHLRYSPPISLQLPKPPIAHNGYEIRPPHSVSSSTTGTNSASVSPDPQLMNSHLAVDRLTGISHSVHNIIQNRGIDIVGRRKRRANPIPQENKDGAYWERRKRNNESAKRSREVRRVKEIHSNARLMFLEEENIKLRAEVDTLRDEIGKLREMLYCNRHDSHPHHHHH